LQHQALDTLAQGNNLGGVHVVANRKFPRRDDAFGFKANVQQHFVTVDLHDDAHDQVAVFELEHTVAHQGGQVGADHVVFGDYARNIIAPIVKGTHLLGGEEAKAFRHTYIHYDHTGVR
jgi:hypothetical protein